jgi:hypothetical protein
MSSAGGKQIVCQAHVSVRPMCHDRYEILHLVIAVMISYYSNYLLLALQHSIVNYSFSRSSTTYIRVIAGIL